MAVRIGEGGDAHTPLPVDRAGQQLDAELLERRAGRVDVVDEDAELEPRAGLGAGDRRGLDLLPADELTSRFTNSWSNFTQTEVSSSKTTSTPKIAS